MTWQGEPDPMDAVREAILRKTAGTKPQFLIGGPLDGMVLRPDADSSFGFLLLATGDMILRYEQISGTKTFVFVSHKKVNR